MNLFFFTLWIYPLVSLINNDKIPVFAIIRFYLIIKEIRQHLDKLAINYFFRMLYSFKSTSITRVLQQMSHIYFLSYTMKAT